MTPWAGGVVSERAHCVLAPNPSPMTLDGTNTWVLAEPGADECAVIDPGPLDEAHLAAVVAQVGGRRVTHTLLTHSHADHAEGAARFARLTGSPVLALDDGLADGDRLHVGGLDLLVVHTPGHTRDSTCFVIAAENALLTGDTILGRGTTVVAHPDGVLADYLGSLARLKAMTGSGDVVRLLPGHGPVLGEADDVVAFYLRHRRERLDQVRAALAAGDRDADDVVARVYADVPRAVWPAARLSVLAQLEYLRG